MPRLPDFYTTINDVEYGVIVIEFTETNRNYSCTDSDLEFRGFVEFDYKIVDSEGKWLKDIQRSMTADECQEVDDMVMKLYSGE